ncbi:MAG: hypothetical protein ACRCR1_06700 [Aeromonas sp.]
MENRPFSAVALFVLGAILLLIQHLPERYWPVVTHLQPVPGMPIAAERLAWREWQAYQAAIRASSLAPEGQQGR